MISLYNSRAFQKDVRRSPVDFIVTCVVSENAANFAGNVKRQSFHTKLSSNMNKLSRVNILDIKV